MRRAMVLNDTALSLNERAMSQIVGGAMFGEPGPRAGGEFPQAIKDKVKINCARGDPVCIITLLGFPQTSD